MSRRGRIWLVGVSLALAAFAGWGAWEAWATAPAPQSSESKAGKHATPPQVLANTLERLHQEALAHFLADPKNGFYRMMPVFEKVVKDWKTPTFSSGELDEDQPMPFLKDMERIHQGTVKDFLSFEPLKPARRPVRFGTDENAKYDRSKKVWEAKSIDLVGLIKHEMPVVYVSDLTAAAGEQRKGLRIRDLDDFELAGLDAFREGKNLHARSRQGVIRLLGSVRADATCLKCHEDKKQGDLLGAFSYVLREAEYVRAPFGKRTVPPGVAPEAKK